MAHTSPSPDLLDGRILKYLDDSDDPAASVLLWWQGVSSRGSMQPLADTSSSVVVTAEENTPPTGTDNSLTLLETEKHTFQTADFGFSDVDGHALSSVFVTALPTSGGTLFLDNVIFAGGDVSAAQLDGGLFEFRPAVTTTGPADATFKFRVVDSMGGVSDPENQVSIHITPIDRTLSGTPGTDASDSLVGGGGNDSLDGLGGADLMTGWGGDDTYHVDDADDAIIEQPGGGHDVVHASASYTLPAEVEDLNLTESGRLNGVGNAADNHLIGNAAANRLEGGAGNDTLDGAGGADTLTGETGDDTYVVDDNRDKVNENANQGLDTVRSSITRTLETHVENLELLGAASINGSGNASANVITGNDGANVLGGLGGDDTLSGGAGNDTLVGGAGADLLTGGIGSDVFDYNAISESSFAVPDEITDFTQGEDRIDLSGIDADTTSPKDQAFAPVPSLSGNPGEVAFSAGELVGEVNGEQGADFRIWLGVSSVDWDNDFIL